MIKLGKNWAKHGVFWLHNFSWPLIRTLVGFGMYGETERESQRQRQTELVYELSIIL